MIRRWLLGSTAIVGSLAVTSAAHAVCMAQTSSLGVGLPSISATEVSTTQAVEMVRRRQQEEQFASAIPASMTTPAPPPAQPGSATAGQAPAPKSAPKAAAKPAPTPPAAAQPQTYASDRYASQGSARGIWAQGYGDYEKRSNLTIDVSTPGAIDRKEYTGGFLAGTDWTLRANRDTGLMLGLFGGYNRSSAEESEGLFRARNEDGVNIDIFRRSNAEQETEGGFLGAYAAYFRDRFSLQSVFKADIYDVNQSDVILPVFATGQPCGFPPRARNGSADLNNYIIESNATYRFDLSANSWWEPIVGFRYTYSDYSNQTGELSVGSDGHIWRVQGGVRFGRIWQMPMGYLTTTLTGMLYSDVSINGFAVNAGEFSPATPLTDEGKLRVLGQVAARWDIGNGYSTLMQIESRGGDDLFGIGGRLGLRYEW